MRRPSYRICGACKIGRLGGAVRFGSEAASVSRYASLSIWTVPATFVVIFVSDPPSLEGSCAQSFPEFLFLVAKTADSGERHQTREVATRQRRWQSLSRLHGVGCGETHACAVRTHCHSEDTAEMIPTTML